MRLAAISAKFSNFSVGNEIEFIYFERWFGDCCYMERLNASKPAKIGFSSIPANTVDTEPLDKRPLSTQDNQK